MFKEADKGNKEVSVESEEEIIKNKSKIVATSCTFCNTMLNDGIMKSKPESEIEVLDISELLVKKNNL